MKPAFLADFQYFRGPENEDKKITVIIVLNIRCVWCAATWQNERITYELISLMNILQLRRIFLFLFERIRKK